MMANFLKATLYRMESEAVNFKTEYDIRVKEIDDYIESYLNSLDNVDNILVDGMKYAVLNGGKRLRSILCTEICCCFSGERAAAMPYAAAIEFIHAYSLVHDDLPAMDNADYRRGLPSCHKKYGEDIAILIGDALLNTAFELMLKYSNITPGALDAAKIISHSSGIFGMVNGQMQDLALSNRKVATKEDLISLIEQKTMALIRGAACSGAAIAMCSQSYFEAVDKYAYHLGLAFQIRDDFEDYIDDENDEHACPNFINVCGFEEAKLMLNKNVKHSFKYLNMIKNNQFLKELNDYLFSEVK